jgi:hypothetical protein
MRGQVQYYRVQRAGSFAQNFGNSVLHTHAI